MSCADLIALRVERRRIAAAVFSGLRLDYTCTRELYADGPRALYATRRFIHWLLETFQPQQAVVEAVEAEEGSRRAELRHIVMGTLMLSRIPRVSTEPGAILADYAVPQLRTKVDLRRIATDIWPKLGERSVHPAVLDAAALGLAHQVNGLFSDK